MYGHRNRDRKQADELRLKHDFKKLEKGFLDYNFSLNCLLFDMFSKTLLIILIPTKICANLRQ